MIPKVNHWIGQDDAIRRCRKPSIVAEAAHRILSGDSASQTGQFLIDEDVLRAGGETDFDRYAVDPSAELFPDYFL